MSRGGGMVWTAVGSSHRPLEATLGARANGDPLSSSNTSKCVGAYAYGRSLLPTPRLYSPDNMTMDRFGRPGPGSYSYAQTDGFQRHRDRPVSRASSIGSLRSSGSSISRNGHHHRRRSHSAAGVHSHTGWDPQQHFEVARPSQHHQGPWLDSMMGSSGHRAQHAVQSRSSAAYGGSAYHWNLPMLHQ